VSRKPQAARTAGPVGRDDVLAELRRVVDEAVGGRGHLLLLAGEAGIGKTTMLTAAAAFAESRGIRVGWGWGWPGEGAPGYWPWVQVMRMLGLDIPWPAEDRGQPVRDAPASERFRLFDEVTSLLLAESRIQPLLLLLDDLQWADQPSQLLLDFLARRLPAGAVAVVGGYRDTEPAPGPVLTALAARTTVLPLTGLGPDAVGDLVADVVGDQRAAEVAPGVHRRTGGNPFFVQQVSWLLRGGQEGIPPGVREALELRFAALPGAAAAALRTAAVIGQRFSADLAALVSGQPSGAVAEALAAGVRARVVSRDGTDAYRFAHDLFREYAYDQLPAAERASLHGGSARPSRPAGRLAVRSRWPSWPGTSCSRTRYRRRPGSTARPRPSRLPPGWPTRKRSGTGSTRSPPRTPGQPSVPGPCSSWRRPVGGRARARPRARPTCAPRYWPGGTKP
jgi:hypothetical protein